MPVAPFRVSGLTDGSNRAPPGGCWLPASGPSVTSVRGLPADVAPESPLEIFDRPSLYYPEGYPLPVGTTTYAVLFSHTTDGRNIPYVPTEYTPRAVLRIQQRLRRVRAEAERLGVEFGLTRERIEEYVANRGPTPAERSVLDRASRFGLRPGESYTGRQFLLLYTVGTPAAERLRLLRVLWDDIVAALSGS